MSEHYYTEKPTSDIKEKNFVQRIGRIELSLTSVSGVFSHEHKVDKVSELMIKTYKPTGRTVLDLGCGYGAIGLFIKALYPDRIVCLADVNERAINYASINASKNHIDVKVVKSDLFSAFDDIQFDDIVTNPPLAAGKKLLINLIEQAHDHLNPNGSLWLVAYHNKGGSTLKKIMEERFSNVRDMEKSGGVRVYRSIKLRSDY